MFPLIGRIRRFLRGSRRRFYHQVGEGGNAPQSLDERVQCGRVGVFDDHVYSPLQPGRQPLQQGEAFICDRHPYDAPVAALGSRDHAGRDEPVYEGGGCR